MNKVLLLFILTFCTQWFLHFTTWWIKGRIISQVKVLLHHNREERAPETVSCPDEERVKHRGSVFIFYKQSLTRPLAPCLHRKRREREPDATPCADRHRNLAGLVRHHMSSSVKILRRTYRTSHQVRRRQRRHFKMDTIHHLHWGLNELDVRSDWNIKINKKKLHYKLNTNSFIQRGVKREKGEGEGGRET